MCQLNQQQHNPQVIVVDAIHLLHHHLSKVLAVFFGTDLVEHHPIISGFKDRLGGIVVLSGLVGFYGLFEQQTGQLTVALELPLILRLHRV